ncbi:hypothetical protein FE772_04255 [Lysobacter enzymogenes]|nr:hypothetical protein [Lysobacter enzymogenes]QCW25002.1 hypothetical protein FE772_04255 [Lysobacter enzymogenes]
MRVGVAGPARAQQFQQHDRGVVGIVGQARRPIGMRAFGPETEAAARGTALLQRVEHRRHRQAGAAQRARPAR